MNLVRNVLAVVLGLVLGGAVNMLIVTFGSQLVPPPAGVDVTDTASISASMHLYTPKHFAVPFVAHALGTLVGAAAAYFVAVSHKAVLAYIVGAAFLAGGIAASIMLPAPIWFIVLDLGLAYLPFAWLGIRLSKRIAS